MTDRRPINPDVDFQADLLAAKVTRHVMSLEAAAAELADWQTDTLAKDSSAQWRPIDPRTLIVTHMMNRLLKRGY